MPPVSSEKLSADVVVVGSGAGGAPAAARLAEAGLEVVLLEAGHAYSSADFNGREAEMMLRLGRLASTRDAGLALYAGQCLGGSTVVNDALCWRTPPEVLAQWRDEFGLGLSNAELAPFLDRAWRDVNASPTGREHLNRNAYRLELGAQRLGWAAEAMPRNVRGCLNLGLCNFGCPSNAKQSMLLTYVPRAKRAGARVLANTRATRVQLEAGAAHGVVAEQQTPGTAELRKLEIRTPRVLLAAGVLETGALLLRSGLNGAAGSGLQFHSSVHVTARFAEPVHGYFGPSMSYAISEFADVNGHTGPGFMIENTTVHPVGAAQNLPNFGPAHERAMQALPYLGKSVVVLRDHARGRVNAAGEIDYVLGEDDLARMWQGVLATAEAYLAADAEEVFLPVDGLAPLRTRADLDKLRERGVSQAELFSLYAVHLFGGAGMGGTRGESVCNPEGQVWDTRGLYVCDAASLPSNTGVNPQITIMANALRIAEGVAS